ncbi:hypothetical protein H6796_01365 [Candidatus Nomurabacteria bacterium]|nr:hypothetical protein [Candidatus Nomurabacteria bacterium]
MKNEVLLKQLVRQVKILNFWITLFGSLFLVGIVIAGFLLWQVVAFIGQTNQKIEDMKTSASDSLNVQKKTCESDGKIGSWFRENTEVCK